MEFRSLISIKCQSSVDQEYSIEGIDQHSTAEPGLLYIHIVQNAWGREVKMF